MALGTFFSGDVKCAWCGSYIKNTDGGLGGALGLDIVKRAGAAAIPHYCSNACKIAAQQAKDGGSVNSNSGSGTTVVQRTSMWAEAMKGPSDAQVQAQQEIDRADRAEKEEIQNMRFDGSADDIAADLNKLFTKYNGIPSGLAGLSAFAAGKNQGAAILEKIEFGIMKLRKVDSDAADFFQKKFDGLTQKKKGFFGLGKK